VLRLRTLGGLSIERVDGSSVTEAANSARRRLTLVAVLAASTRPVPRDKLHALFWPEADMEHARHALGQALYAIKRELKEPELFLGRDELTLNPAVITSDVAELRASIAAGRLADAAGLYAGPFLDGVFMSGAIDAERWIDDQRLRIAQEVEATIETLATAASTRGDHRMAAHWWSRLAAIDPRKTRVVVALMSELAASGDRASALRQAEAYRTLVSDDLDADPNPAVIAFAEQLRREPTTPAEPAVPSPSSEPLASPDASSNEPPFAGRYVIERVVGRGGASTVYLAHDLRNARRVALKVLRRELGGGPVAERFRREIVVTANLQHPHILAVHDWGEADGVLYFAMPFVEGEPLRDRLHRERRLPIRDVVEIARDVAGALAYAHERGIVHRDIKPENILLTSGHAVVADFGIALVSETVGTDTPRRTDPGVVLGTPAYLSPEQASGELDVDARSDQYSLACVLYESLAGTPPFDGKDPIDLLTQRLDATPPAVRSRRPDVSEQVDRALTRALSTSPADRFADMTTFAAALTPHAPVVSETSPTPQRASRPSRRTWRRAMGAAALAVVALGLTMAWRLTNRPFGARAWVVVADVDNRTRDTIFTRALDAALLTGLQQSSYVNVLPRARVDDALRRMRRLNDSIAVPLDERTAREIAEREGVRGVALASIDQADSSYFISLRIVDAKTGAAFAAERHEARRRSEVLSAIDEAVRRIRADIGESASEIAKHDRPLPLATTQSLEALKSYADALAAARQTQRAAAVELLTRAVALDSDFALAHSQLGAQYYIANNRPAGDRHYDRALALLDRLTQREQLLIRAGAESYRGNRARAIELRRALLAEYPDDPGVWGDIGYDYMRMGQSEQAIDALQEQLRRAPRSPRDLINLATSYKNLGRFDEARGAYRSAFELQPALLVFANLNHEFGSMLAVSGRLDEARAVFDTMLRQDADHRAQGERSLGFLAMYRGRFAEARRHFHAATLISQTMPGRGLTEARNRLLLAAVEQELGDVWRDSVRAELTGVMTLFRNSYMEPLFLTYLGKSLVRSGRTMDAHEVLDSLRRRARPDNPRDQTNVLLLAGELALASGRSDSAVAIARVAYTADPTPFVGETLARALAQTGDRGAAAMEYEKIASRPKDWFGWEAQLYAFNASLEAGQLYEQLGDVASARRAYDRHVGQWPAPDANLESVARARNRIARLAATTK
jgi:serine/threonine-protein kinase